MSEPHLARAIDAALVARALQGDRVAFEVLVVKYQRRVAATVRRLVSDKRIAEELTQEVFLSVVVALPSFQPDGAFAAWLLTIARNAAKSYLRSGQSRQDDRPIQLLDDAGASDASGLRQALRRKQRRTSHLNPSTPEWQRCQRCSAVRF